MIQLLVRYWLHCLHRLRKELFSSLVAPKVELVRPKSPVSFQGHEAHGLVRHHVDEAQGRLDQEAEREHELDVNIGKYVEQTDNQETTEHADPLLDVSGLVLEREFVRVDLSVKLLLVCSYRHLTYQISNEIVQEKRVYQHKKRIQVAVVCLPYHADQQRKAEPEQQHK